jgi:four helix bundle protein
MSKIKSFKDLLIWQKGIVITILVYKIIADFPENEIYALSSQIKRCAVSIPSNIAEGYGRQSTQSYIHFIKIARGSLYELETQLIIAEKLKFFKSDNLITEIMLLITEENKMINSFLNKLESNNK